VSPFQFVRAVLYAWRQREYEGMIAFLREENRVLKVRLEGRRLRLEDHERSLVVRMATDNPTWGYTRIQGALKNVGHHLGRSTIARILEAAGLPPGRQRPMAWRTFLQAHWPALVAADFFTTRCGPREDS
jgi:hypothetical protein